MFADPFATFSYMPEQGSIEYDDSLATSLGLPQQSRFVPSDANDPWDATYPDASHIQSFSRSLRSTDCSTAYALQWPSQTCTSNEADAGHVYYCQTYAPHRDTVFRSGRFDSISADTRDSVEQRDYVLPRLLQSITESTDMAEMINRQRYLRSYWATVHRQYPVIHKPTFTCETASPLLRTAILALGAQALGDPTALSYAKIWHEKCLKVLSSVRNLFVKMQRVLIRPSVQLNAIIHIDSATCKPCCLLSCSRFSDRDGLRVNYHSTLRTRSASYAKH